MKKTMFAFILVLAGTCAAHADELCGVLSSQMMAPMCAAGAPCPRFELRDYFINSDDYGRVAVATEDGQVLQAMQGLNNQAICAEGEVGGNSFVIESITAE